MWLQIGILPLLYQSHIILMHYPINYIDVPEDVVRQGMQGAGMPEPTVNALLELYASYKAGQAATVSPVVEQVTGKQPISFEQFAKD